MTIEEVNAYAKENEIDLMVFSAPAYNKSIIGISYDNRVIYDYELMEIELMEDGMNEEEANEFIHYNTLRALSYYDNSPIVMYVK